MRILIKSEKWLLKSAKALLYGHLSPLSVTSAQLTDGLLETRDAITAPSTLRMDLFDVNTVDRETDDRLVFQICQGVTGFCSENEIKKGEVELHIDPLRQLLIRVLGKDDDPLSDTEVSLALPGVSYKIRSDGAGLCRVLCHEREFFVCISGDPKSAFHVVFKGDKSSSNEQVVLRRSTPGLTN
jgi:hypothetical protein